MMDKPAAEYNTKDEDSSDDLHDASFSSRGCCSFNFPCFGSRPSGNWERISSYEAIERSWLGKGVDSLKKARGWSELVAGPKWKTFIRRFNRTDGRTRIAKFQYDPLSYSLNFDQGWGQNEDSEGPPLFLRDFSSRYSATPAPKVEI